MEKEECFKRAVNLPCAIGDTLDDDVTEGTSVTIRVSHFYTFFELSYTLVTTQAHGL